ncbi:uncharacterized protein [Linepithema humile]|uniref:uncharacterized protein isoform X2 n=1 Tax=Linepithema humile TaxID=83485 RepID=UPI00351F4D0E
MSHTPAEIQRTSPTRESAIQNEPYERTVKSDGTSSRNEDESRCKSNRGRKTRRKMPDGVIIDLSNDVYGTSRGGRIKFNVISMHSLVPEAKFLAKYGFFSNATKKDKYIETIKSLTTLYTRISFRRYPRFSLWNRGARKKRMIDSSVLAIFYDKNCRNAEKSTKRKRKNSQKELVDNTVHSDINTTVDVSNQLENALSKQRELEDNLQSFCITDGIFDSKCCHHDALFHDVRYSVLNAKQTCVGNMRKHIANFCCTIFDDTRQEHHICDQKDYNADGSDFNAEMQPDWMTDCFHSEHAEGCFCVSNEYYPDINMQHDCCSSIPMRTTRLLKNSALPKKHQRKEIKQFENIALEFATETDEYSPDRDERSNRCANCVEERKSMASTIRKCAASSGSMADLRDSSIVDASQCEIDTRSEERGRRTTTTTATMMGREGKQPNKSDLLKAADTRDTHARRDCIERCCGGRVVAVPSRADRSPGEKGGSARGVDSKWKPGSIETDARQLDYKWKRRIATVDAGMRASVNFKGKRDSR